MLSISRRIRFDWQILPLLLAAVWGLIAAYNTRPALVQFGFILLGIVFYFLLANLPDPIRVTGQSRSVLAGLLAVVPLALGLYFLWTNDWLPSVDRLRVLNPVLEVLGDGPLSSRGLGLNPNSIGSVIAMLLPLQVFALKHARWWVSGVVVAISLVALLLSGARGAWLALALAAFAWASWIVISARVANRRQARVIWLTFAIGGGIACVAAMALTPLGGWLLECSGDRVNIWHSGSPCRCTGTPCHATIAGRMPRVGQSGSPGP